jgi:hypothetical protein
MSMLGARQFGASQNFCSTLRKVKTLFSHVACDKNVHLTRVLIAEEKSYLDDWAISFRKRYGGGIATSSDLK